MNNTEIDKAEDALDCPNCDNQGWYPEMQYVGYDEHGDAYAEPVQVQCEFCYTVPNSVFNTRTKQSES